MHFRPVLNPLLTALLLSASLFSFSATSAANTTAAPQLGLQAWTFRDRSLVDTIAVAKRLGVRQLQVYSGQKLGGDLPGVFGVTMPKDVRARVRELAAAQGITLASFGVMNPADDAAWDRTLALARDLGLSEIVTEVDTATLARIAPRFREAGLRLSLHNHPTPSRYADPAVALAAASELGDPVGLCADTGHWARSGFDPVAALRQAEGRIHSLHFKDLNEAGVKKARDVPWGTGVSRAGGQLAELRRQGFTGVVYIEYEHQSPTLEQEVAASVRFFEEALRLSPAELASERLTPPGYVASPAVAQLWAGERGTNSARWPMPQPLFAPDLSNALFKPGSWVMENGELVAKGGGDIWTQESYGDYTLTLEFQCAEKSNSGVLIRCSDTKNWLHNTIEVQVLQGGASNNRHIVGAIFDIQGPTRQIKIEPGQWYRYAIFVRGSQIRVLLNEEEVNNINLDQWKEAGKNPDGTANKFQRAYKDMPRVGRIGLQYHGAPIRFRYLQIEPLQSKPSGTAAQPKPAAAL